MSQKSNLLTLRKKKNLNLLVFNSKICLYGYQYLTFFKFLLKKKNILITFKTLNFVNNQIFFNLNCFFKTSKYVFYRRCRKKKSLSRIHTNFFKLFFNQLNFLKNNLISFNIKNVNTTLNKKLLVFFFKSLKSFLGSLFERRYNLFVDFLKIVSLLVEKKINSETFLSVLGEIFHVLPKTKHSNFFLLLKTVFFLLTSNKNINSSVKGIKLLINGKLKGKMRASSILIFKGSVPNQTLSKNIEFSKLHTYTRYGAFGFQLWICY